MPRAGHTQVVETEINRTEYLPPSGSKTSYAADMEKEALDLLFSGVF